ncbi:antitoxin of toxin-antitoxin stability system [Rickettsia endosymbiont of Cantharis rufa]|uniref:antitoxin of toxin-antitoxin stability system n=1 Tax=Rickettsia endosymbiont of Cantharis rufa TaxID=3066248 RepID=UPI00313310CF
MLVINNQKLIISKTTKIVDVKNYTEEKADLLIALSRIEREKEVILLEDIKKKYSLED